MHMFVVGSLLYAAVSSGCNTDLYIKTRSLAVARITDRTSCQWLSRSFKVNDFLFQVIWKPLCHFFTVSKIRPVFRWKTHIFPLAYIQPSN